MILRKAIEKAVEGGYKWIEPDEMNSEDYIIGTFDMSKEYFSHSFAKAFFLDKWREMLQNMVLEEEPLKFLEKWL